MIRLLVAAVHWRCDGCCSRLGPLVALPLRLKRATGPQRPQPASATAPRRSMHPTPPRPLRGMQTSLLPHDGILTFWSLARSLSPGADQDTGHGPPAGAVSAPDSRQRPRSVAAAAPITARATTSARRTPSAISPSARFQPYRLAARSVGQARGPTQGRDRRPPAPAPADQRYYGVSGTGSVG